MLLLKNMNNNGDEDWQWIMVTRMEMIVGIDMEKKLYCEQEEISRRKRNKKYEKWETNKIKQKKKTQLQYKYK